VVKIADTLRRRGTRKDQTVTFLFVLIESSAQAVGLRGEGKMPRIYTTADYIVKEGRFLILSAFSGDRCAEVGADVVEGSNEANEIAVSLQDPECRRWRSDSYSIHDGFIIANSKDSHDCAQALFVLNREEAEECLARFLDDLNAY
jgi:hypothetical protein